MNIDYDNAKRTARQSARATVTTLGSLASQLPAAYRVLELVGVQTRRMRRRRMMSNLGLVSGGAAVGAAVALLLAPRSGRATQEKLLKHVEKARNYVSHAAAEAANGPGAGSDDASSDSSRVHVM